MTGVNVSFSLKEPATRLLNRFQTLPGKENELMIELTKETDIARKLPLEHVLHVAELFQVSL